MPWCENCKNLGCEQCASRDDAPAIWQESEVRSQESDLADFIATLRVGDEWRGKVAGDWVFINNIFQTGAGITVVQFSGTDEPQLGDWLNSLDAYQFRERYSGPNNRRAKTPAADEVCCDCFEDDQGVVITFEPGVRSIPVERLMKEPAVGDCWRHKRTRDGVLIRTVTICNRPEEVSHVIVEHANGDRERLDLDDFTGAFEPTIQATDIVYFNGTEKLAGDTIGPEHSYHEIRRNGAGQCWYERATGRWFSLARITSQAEVISSVCLESRQHGEYWRCELPYAAFCRQFTKRPPAAAQPVGT